MKDERRVTIETTQGSRAAQGAQEQTRREKALGRREFLRKLGAGATVAAAGSGSVATPAQADTESNDEKRKSRYRETEEVKTFYRVNRYPS